MKARTQITDFRSNALNAWFSRWTARVMVELGALRRFEREGRFPSDDIFLTLGVKEPEGKTYWRQAEKAIRARYRRLEARLPRRKDVLWRNVELLGAAVGLDEVEQALLAFAAGMSLSEGLSDAMEELELLAVRDLARGLGRVLRQHPARIERALRPRSILRSSGLVMVSRPERDRDPVLTLCPGLGHTLVDRHQDADALLQDFFRARPSPALTLDAYAHMADEVTLLRRLVGGAVAKGARGVNVLLHGEPGTGKTELARALARALDAPLYEVIAEDAQGDPVLPRQRFASYSLCQRVVRGRPRAVVLFDEMEDVFPRPGFFSPEERVPCKAWTNRVLEENAVPTLWISNHVAHIDPAYLRRFDLVLEVKAPPSRVRRAMLARALAAHLPDDAALARAAQDDRLTPAHIQRAARVLELVAPASRQEAGQVMSRVLEGALSQHRRRASALSTASDGPRYDLGNVNASVDLAQVASRLAGVPQGTLCLYGPPGTGKTAFAHHVAEKVGRPLVAARASDLLGCYVGETEERLARLFDEATRNRAVLLLDEADSFLRDRGSARQVWEVSQVNELLVQLENFEGLFFAATNAFDQLDAASLRRFELKIRFAAPTPEQRWRLFQDSVQKLGLELPDSGSGALRRRLDALGGLTPGDFRTVLRKARLVSCLRTPDQVIGALEEELRARPGGRKVAIGFGAQQSACQPPV